MFRTCLRELRRVCGIHQTLPRSYTFPGLLLEIDGQPLVRGYYGDVRLGFLNGSKVRVKRLFASNGAGRNSTKVYRPHHHFTPFAEVVKPTEFLRRGGSVETLGTPKYRLPPWHYDLPSTPPANLGLGSGWKPDGVPLVPSRCRPARPGTCPSYIKWLTCLPLRRYLASPAASNTSTPTT